MDKRGCWVVVLLLFFISGCKTIPHDASDLSLSCKLEVKYPRPNKDGYDKVDGVVKMVKGELLKISFRLPVIRTEVFLLEYTPSSLLMVNRRDKVYSLVASPKRILIDGVSLPSLDEMEQLIQHVFKVKKDREMDAQKAGLGFLQQASLKFDKFSQKRLVLSPTVLSRKYKKVSIETFFETIQ